MHSDEEQRTGSFEPSEESLDSDVREDNEPEPEIALSLASDADSDSNDLDPDMEQPVNLPTESYEADPDDRQGADDKPECEGMGI